MDDSNTPAAASSDAPLDPAAAAQAAADAAAKQAADEAAALAASLAEMAKQNAAAVPLTLLDADEIDGPLNAAGVPQFGATFASELAAAGVLGLKYSYSSVPGVLLFDPSIAAADRAKVAAVVAAHNPAAVPPAIPPDCGSLAYWLTALDLWQRTDSTGKTGTATSQVQASIKALVDAGNPLGTLAARQFGNANTVVLADLLKIAGAFGFSAADCAESLWRANQIALGDMSGKWPLATSS